MQIDRLSELIIHKVGNKGLDEPLFIAQNAIELNDDISSVLRAYFFTSFKEEEFYRFHHDINLSMNEVFACVKKIFEEPSLLKEQSAHLAQHLYNQSMHPKVKAGEFYIAFFEDSMINGVNVPAIGLFKSENRDTFIQLNQVFDGFELDAHEGINIQKLDKGCLIFNIEEEQGYIVSIVDNTNKGTEAQYWKDLFLQVRIINNDFHQTNQFLGITKQFVTKHLDQEFDVSKADKIDLLNRSVEYFKSHEAFNKEEFEEEVFGDSNVINSFRNFDQNFREEHQIEVDDEFDISAQAVKKQARVFKSVLKLDKNFHIYIHGDKELIESGVDEDGRKFYKIYYENES